MRIFSACLISASVVLATLAAAETAAFVTEQPDGGKYQAGMTYAAALQKLNAWRGDCDLICIGDSITWGWDAEPWAKRLAPRKAYNYGVPGDGTQNMLFRLANTNLAKLHPKVAVILAGVNNYKEKPEAIHAGVKAVLAKTREIFPGIKIILVDILPCASRPMETLQAANALIAKECDEKTVFHLSLADKMVAENGSYRGLRADKLHLTAEGYQIWADALEPLLTRLGLPAPAGP